MYTAYPNGKLGAHTHKESVMQQLRVSSTSPYPRALRWTRFLPQPAAARGLQVSALQRCSRDT